MSDQWSAQLSEKTALAKILADKEENGQVYAVLEPEWCVLKIGWSTNINHPIAYVKHTFKQHGILAKPTLIWAVHGDFREEMFMQAHLAYRFDAAWQSNTRMSEWFYTEDESILELVALFNQIYSFIPQESEHALPSS